MRQLKNLFHNDTENWRSRRVLFFQSAAQFLNGVAEEKILAGFDKLLLSPTLTPEGKRSILGLQAAARKSFDEARAVFGQLIDVRTELKGYLQKSVCLVVPNLSAPVSRVTAAAALGDSILTGRYLSKVSPRRAFLTSALVALILSGGLAVLPPLTAGLIGAAAVLIAGLGTLILFTFLGIWLNPLLFIFSLSAVVITSLSSEALWHYGRKKNFRKTLAPRMSLERFDELIPLNMSTEGTLPAEGRDASILAVRAKRIALFPLEEAGVNAGAEKIVTAYRIYHHTIGDLLRNCGAFVYAMDDDLILAVFGAPLDLTGHRLRAELSGKAVIEAEATLAQSLGDAGIAYKMGTLCVGIDSGLVDFGDTGIPGFSGYSAYGPIPVRARLLSGLGERYDCRILITENVKREMPDGWEGHRLDKLVTDAEGTEEFFYNLRFPIDAGRSATA